MKLARALEVILYATAILTVVALTTIKVTIKSAQAAECELTQADAMVHLNKAVKELPATLTVLDGAKATAFIDSANLLQSMQVFDGDTIAVIGLTNKDVVQVTIFKEGCRTYQSQDMTHAQWAAIIKAVSAKQL